MIARGFDEVGQRFDNVELRLDHVEQRLDGHNLRFNEIDQRFVAPEQKMDAGFKSVRDDINALASDHFPRKERGELQKRVEHLETHVGLPHRLQAIYTP